MEVIIKKDYDEMSKVAAEIVAQEKEKKVNAPFKLGLATGSTPIGLYKELIRMHKEKKLDFSTVITFNLDEYIGLKPTHDQSYRYFMNENLFNHINIQPKNTHVPNGLAKDLEKHCEEYDQMIKDSGGLDFQVLGLGGDGHIGFNEPGSSLASRTRIKTLTEETIKDNARFFKDQKDVPKYAITMGVGTILEAKKVILLASGKKKADVLSKAIEGPVTSDITASALQLHPYVVIVCDEEASANLKRREYYKHVYKSTQELKGAQI
jgi:glucosamine-6-phosphate deaminase